MNTFAKVALAGGILLLIFGSVAGFSSFNELEENEKKISNYISEADNNITKTFADADGLGSAGWYIMIQGKYLDENNDDRNDACENMTFSVTDGEGTNVTEESAQFDCYMDDEIWNDEWADPIKDDDWIVVAYVCATIDENTGYDCSIGETYTISSNKNMKLYDADARSIEVGEIVVRGVFQAGGASFLGCCLLLVGGIAALTMGKPEQNVVYQQSNGSFVVDPTETHMSQPVLEQQHESYVPPTQGGLTPPSGGL